MAIAGAAMTLIMKNLKVAFSAVLLAAFFTLCLTAQTPTGQIYGSVVDPSGLVVPNASVTVTETQTGRTDRAQTRTAGEYIVRSLPPGAYEVSFEAQGFKRTVRSGITVTTFQNVRVDATLELGATAQSVLVTGEAPLVDTRSGSVGALVDGEPHRGSAAERPQRGQPREPGPWSDSGRNAQPDQQHRTASER
jgi:hypothetical protein